MTLAARAYPARRQHLVRTADGGHLRVHSFGAGPGVVLVCGTNTAASAYFRTARKLRGILPVHVYDRRGRPGSSEQPPDYSMATEISDLRKVLDSTGSTAVFGHSFGGAVALEAGLQLPVTKIAVYDAVPNIGNVVPTGFFNEFEQAVERGAVSRAVGILGKGISAELRGNRLPDPAFQALVWIMSKATRKGRAWRWTVRSAVKELAWLRVNTPSADRYAAIPVPVRVLYGEGSDAFYGLIAGSLSHHIPKACCEEVPGAGHGSLDQAPDTLINRLAAFYTAAD